MAKKFYVVWKGRTPGIYTDWATCKKQVEQFAGARYKSFPTLAEAEAAYGGSSSVVFKKSSSSARPSNRQTVKTYTAKEVQALPQQVKIFTDGGCEPNPGEAGSGLALYRNNEMSELWYGLYNPMGTNNTAELNALDQALILAEKELSAGHTAVVLCDSKYSIQCITQWAAGWKKKGWKKSGGEIKNLALIQQIFERYQHVKDDVPLLHVNGHVGVEGNELADRMSILAMQSKQEKFVKYTEVTDIQKILALRAG